MTDNPDRALGALLRRAMGDRLIPDAEGFLTMCADDIVFEFPFAPERGVHRLEGKKALAAYLPRIGRLIRIDGIEVTTIHRSTDPDVVILEMEATGAGVQTGARYDQRYISVVRMREGKIVHYRDYWNPLILLEAAGGEQALAAALTEDQR